MNEILSIRVAASLRRSSAQLKEKTHLDLQQRQVLHPCQQPEKFRRASENKGGDILTREEIALLNNQ